MTHTAGLPHPRTPEFGRKILLFNQWLVLSADVKPGEMRANWMLTEKIRIRMDPRGFVSLKGKLL